MFRCLKASRSVGSSGHFTWSRLDLGDWNAAVKSLLPGITRDVFICRGSASSTTDLVREANNDINEFFGTSNPESTASSQELRGNYSNPVEDSSGPTQDLRLTHVDGQGQATMVDVGHKEVTRRRAVACARVYIGKVAFDLVASNSIKKGNVLEVAKLAGIMAAKQTSNLIPLCHNIPLSSVFVSLDLNPQRYSVNISATAMTKAQTGVEMEALTAASVAALTVYDMVKAVTKHSRIGDIHLQEKEGGKSGSWSYATSDPSTKEGG